MISSIGFPVTVAWMPDLVLSANSMKSFWSANMIWRKLGVEYPGGGSSVRHLTSLSTQACILVKVTKLAWSIARERLVRAWRTMMPLLVSAFSSGPLLSTFNLPVLWSSANEVIFLLSDCNSWSFDTYFSQSMKRNLLSSYMLQKASTNESPGSVGPLIETPVKRPTCLTYLSCRSGWLSLRTEVSSTRSTVCLISVVTVAYASLKTLRMFAFSPMVGSRPSKSLKASINRVSSLDPGV